MQDVVVLIILLEDMTPLSQCTGTSLETGGHTADGVVFQMMCITAKGVSSLLSLLWCFFSLRHIVPGRSSYYFLQNEMGGDVCSGNSSHIPDKVAIPSPTFRQWNVKVERSIISRSQFVLHKKNRKKHVFCYFPLSHCGRVQVQSAFMVFICLFPYVEMEPVQLSLYGAALPSPQLMRQWFGSEPTLRHAVQALLQPLQRTDSH